MPVPGGPEPYREWVWCQGVIGCEYFLQEIKIIINPFNIFIASVKIVTSKINEEKEGSVIDKTIGIICYYIDLK